MIYSVKFYNFIKLDIYVHSNSISRGFSVSDDPLEQNNLFDAKPQVVSFLKSRIDYYRSIMVQNTFSFPLAVDNVTTTFLGEIRVPRHDYCKPSVDFPLEAPTDPTCRP